MRQIQGLGVVKVIVLGVLSSALFALGQYVHLASTRPMLQGYRLVEHQGRYVAGTFLLALAILGFVLTAGMLIIYVRSAARE